MAIQSTQNPVLPPLHIFLRCGLAPITKKYLDQSTSIAKQLQTDSKSWLQAFEALPQSEQQRVSVGGTVTLLASVLTIGAFPSMVGCFIAFPMAFLGGNNAAQADSLKKWGKELKEAMPLIEKELTGLKPEEKERVLSIFKKQINLLKEAEAGKNTDFSRKRTLAYSSAAWTAGVLTGIPGLSSLGVVIGGITAIRLTLDAGKKMMQDAAIAPRNIQAEINQIQVSG